MDKINIYFINKLRKKESIDIKSDKLIKIKIYILNLSNYELTNQINNIKNIFNMYSSIKKIDIAFEKDIDTKDKNRILTKVHDLIYSYKKDQKIKLYNVPSNSRSLFECLDKYKDIVMDPNKTPDTYLKWIKKQIPDDYKYNIKKTTEKFFPLTHAVGMGSNYDSYFVHIYPKKINKNEKNIYMIGKSVIYDSGGMNIKGNSMHEMKVDMIGSAIILSTLKLLSNVTSNMEKNTKHNIHLLIPIVENMISSKSTRPGTIVKSMSGKTVEIINTDAEGRLCMADCIDYINLELLDSKKDNMILDVATLTGNTIYISNGVSTISMCNKNGMEYMDTLKEIGEITGEYIDCLKIRDEYNCCLNSSVADIINCDYSNKAGCITAGVFLNYFINNKAPWIHLDVASSTYKNDMVCSHGINLLYSFIGSLE
jgi:leucyl aminopeptidase